MLWASYWLFINTNCTLLPIPVHWHVCNQWDVSNTDRWQLSDELVACIRCSIFSTNQRWAIRIGKQLLGHIVADTMCSDMSVSNQILVTMINDRFKWLSVDKSPRSHVSHCCLWKLYIAQTVLCNDVSLNMFETKYCTFELKLLGDLQRSYLPLK